MDIANFTDSCTPNQMAIFRVIHDEIADIPGIVLKSRYNLPFYYRFSWIFYMNPLNSGGVEVCFTRGHLLSNATGLLNARGRTMIAGVEYKFPNEINLGLFRETFYEALQVDEDFKPGKKVKKGRPFI